MTQEWQEQSNEYLKVRSFSPQPTSNDSLANQHLPPGTTIRASHRLLLGDLQGPRHGPVSPQGRLSSSSVARHAVSIISLVIFFRLQLSRRLSFPLSIEQRGALVGNLFGKATPHLPLGHRVKKESLAILEEPPCLLSGGVTIEAAFVNQLARKVV